MALPPRRVLSLFFICDSVGFIPRSLLARTVTSIFKSFDAFLGDMEKLRGRIFKTPAVLFLNLGWNETKQRETTNYEFSLRKPLSWHR